MRGRGAGSGDAGVLGSKWAATAASVWIQCTSGASYCFGIYSPFLKSSQGYDQSTLDSVAVFKDIGANGGLLSGLLYTYTTSSRSCGGSSNGRCWGGGPWVVHAVGAVQCFAGYFPMWLAVTGLVSRPPVPLMCFYMFIAAHAQTFFNTANVVTAVQNFSTTRGTVVGIMKGFLGLSGAILIQVYRTLYGGNAGDFLLMLALLPTLLPMLLMCLVRVHPSSRPDDKQVVDGFSLVSLLVAGYLMFVIIWENIQPLSLSARLAAFFVLLLLLVSPLAAAALRKIRPMPPSPERTPLKAQEEEEAYKLDASRGEEMDLFQALRNLNFWLLFLAMACSMGSGLATVNNISQVGGSLGYTAAQTSGLVSLWSIWNFLGRFGGGFVSDFFLQRRGWARPLFMAITTAAMSLGHGVIASGAAGSLYAGSVLVGICYGCQWSLMPTVTSEIFGVMHMGTIFNVVAVASPVGSYLLSVQVIGRIYDREASGDKSCSGAHCFRSSFLTMACVAILGAAASLALFFRTRRFYRHVVVERLRRAAAQ